MFIACHDFLFFFNSFIESESERKTTTTTKTIETMRKMFRQQLKVEIKKKKLSVAIK